MSWLFTLLLKGKASRLHHKLALDALRHFRRHDAEEWRNVFLAEGDAYLRGAQAPDEEFKDFRNHVLLVRDNGWGGAVDKAQEWYRNTVQALGKREWPDAVYSAGVLSHYVIDPLLPFHTGQSEREMIVPHAAEGSMAACYDELQALLVNQPGGYPQVSVADRDGWLAQLIRQGAEQANGSYELLIDHYNFEIGVKNPALGFDQDAKVAVARHLGFAAIALARVLERAIREAGVFVPHVLVGPKALFESLQMPMRAMARRAVIARQQAALEAMYAEYVRTGKVIDALSDEEKEIRRMHAEEVLKISLDDLDKQKPGPIGGKFAGPQPKQPVQSTKPTLATENQTRPDTKPAAKGPKRDDLNAPRLAPKPDPSITAEQTRLMREIPGLRPRDSQLLVEIGIKSADDLAGQNARQLTELIREYGKSVEGRRILHAAAPPDLVQVSQWVIAAKKGRLAKAA